MKLWGPINCPQRVYRLRRKEVKCGFWITLVFEEEEVGRVEEEDPNKKNENK